MHCALVSPRVGGEWQTAPGDGRVPRQLEKVVTYSILIILFILYHSYGCRSKAWYVVNTKTAEKWDVPSFLASESLNH